MARVEQKTAAKDYPDAGIVKGDTYYSWQLYKQPVRRSKTRPRPSQLTGSAKLSAAYAVQEALQDALDTATTPEDVVNALDDAATVTREVADEYQESADNMRDAFPNGSPTIEECEEKAAALEQFAGECDDAKASIEALSAADFGDGLGDSPPDDDWSFDDCAPEVQAEWLEDAKNFANEPSLEI